MDRHEGIKNINCNSCEYRTNDSGHLKEHRRRVHENQKLKCKDCDFECKASSSMHFHKNKYHLQVAKKFPCNECSYVAPRQHGLTMHMRSKHENIQLVCDLCTKSHKSESGLKHHKNEEHSESTPPRYPCDQCSNGKHYKTKLNLQRHIEATHEMRKHICETCDSQFATQIPCCCHKFRFAPLSGIHFAFANRRQQIYQIYPIFENLIHYFQTFKILHTPNCVTQPYTDKIPPFTIHYHSLLTQCHHVLQILS